MKVHWGSNHVFWQRNTTKQFLERVLAKYEREQNQTFDVEIVENYDGYYSYSKSDWYESREIKELFKAAKNTNVNELNDTNGETINFKTTQQFVARLNKGEVTAEELKQIWQKFKASKEIISAELNGFTKKELEQYRRGFGRTDYKKAELVQVVYEDFAAYFVPGLSISYNPLSETHFKAIDRLVPKVTDELIQERARKIKENQDEFVKALENPETIRDFERFIAYRGKDKLTNEQLIKFESLKAAETRRYRSWHDDRKYNIEETQIPEGLELTITKSYHSKKGCDIWVVEMSERVERFIYDDLKSRAKSLGGYYSKYSKGFVFESENDANQFVSLSAIDGEANKERAEENRRNKAIEHLETVSDNLEAEATATLETDRKTNTARRARMAIEEGRGQKAEGRRINIQTPSDYKQRKDEASSLSLPITEITEPSAFCHLTSAFEPQANNDLQFAQTIKNIAKALESDEIFMLDRVRYGADVEELESQLYQARNRRNRTRCNRAIFGS